MLRRRRAGERGRQEAREVRQEAPHMLPQLPAHRHRPPEPPDRRLTGRRSSRMPVRVQQPAEAASHAHGPGGAGEGQP